MATLHQLLLPVLCAFSSAYGGVTNEDFGDKPAQPNYETFVAPGDRVVFKGGVFAYKDANAAFMLELGDAPGEGESEFLTSIYCDLGFRKGVAKDGELPLKGEAFKVLAVEGKFGQSSSYVQSGVFLTLESESLDEEVANVNLLVCIKEHHTEWPPNSGVHLQVNELTRLADEGFFVEKK